MKDTLGAILAAVLDMKWVVLGILVGGLLAAKCASADESPATKFSPLMELEGTNSRVLVQQGTFQCKEGQNRAIFVNDLGWLKIGCATITERHVHVEWEAGPATEVDRTPGVTDGPAPEAPYSGGKLPPRNG